MRNKEGFFRAASVYFGGWEKQMKFLITTGNTAERDSFFTPKVLKELKKYGELYFNETGSRGMNKEELIRAVGGMDVLFTGWGTACVDKDVMKAADRLKIHAHTGGSVASFISKEEYDTGVIVLSGNDLYAQSVAEGCLCYTLCAQRRLPAYYENVKNGGWRLQPGYTDGMIGKKIGLVGYGAIARYYAELLRWFHPELLIASGHITDEEAMKAGGRKADLEEIFSTCDIISLHEALNEKNRNMIDRTLLHSIKPGALLVNTARAGIVEESAFYDEVKTQRFRAALDVYHHEPLPEDDILRRLPNVFLMPHMAGPTFDMREKVTLRLLDDILAIREGRPYKSGIPYEYAVHMTVSR
jgi:phosphoglycerate dehydrogenase-like enzyme